MKASQLCAITAAIVTLPLSSSLAQGLPTGFGNVNSGVNGTTGLGTGVAGSTSVQFTGYGNGQPNYGRGNYLSARNGTFINPVGKQLNISPLTPRDWGTNPPANLNTASFTSSIGTQNVNYFRATSGYYYPWFNGGLIQSRSYIPYFAPTLFLNNGSNVPIAKLPSPTVQLADFLTYLDTLLADKKITESLYKQVKLRTTDLQRKLRNMMTNSGNNLDMQAEDEIRTDIENLTKELTEHLGK